MNFNNNTIIPIKGDASFRKFYRKFYPKKKLSTIIVISKKEKNKNLDMVVANLVGVPDSGFNSINNTVSIIDKNSQVDIANKEKTALAFDILRLVEKAL